MEKTQKKLVVPGELVTTERKKLGNHVFVDQGNVYSDVLGFTYPDSDIASVVPLAGNYLPQRGDIVVGVILDQNHAGYHVDIGSVAVSFVRRDISRQDVKVGTVLSARVMDVDEMNEADLDDVRLMFGGSVMQVSPVKIPRIIGKQGSMLHVLKDGTESIIVAGRNGRIWMKNGNTALAKKAIRKIEEIAHLSNVTQTIETYLQKENKKTVKE